jgi:hypothetical protein
VERKELDRIIVLLNAGFHGGAWHGPSVLENVKEISPKTAGAKQKSVHSIAELIYHITSWRIFAVKKINGDAAFNISTENQNWGSISTVDEFELETLVMELSLSHDELINALAEKDDAFLEEIVPGSEYDFYTLLHGILHHDLYHSGQIGILKKITPSAKKDDFEDNKYFSDDFDDDF